MSIEFAIKQESFIQTENISKLSNDILGKPKSEISRHCMRFMFLCQGRL